MKSRTTARFRQALAALPPDVQQLARRTFRVWQKNPSQPSLSFKPVHGTGQPIYSVRIGIHWRALAVRRGDEAVWFWIGSHAEYDQFLTHL